MHITIQIKGVVLISGVVNITLYKSVLFLRMCNPVAYAAMACSCLSQHNLESKGVVFTRNKKNMST